MNYSNVMKSVAVNRVLAVLAVLALVFSTAPVALAGGSVTNMQVTGFDGKCAIVGENVTVSATVSATIPQGQLSQYGYVIYWGDGQTYDSGTGFFKDSPRELLLTSVMTMHIHQCHRQPRSQ